MSDFNQFNNLQGKSLEQQARFIFNNLDTADGNVDKKISASVWNEFVKTSGGNTIKEFIDENNAMKSIMTYLKRSDSSTVAKMVTTSMDLQPKNADPLGMGEDFKKLEQARDTIREIEQEYGKYDVVSGGPTGGLGVLKLNKEKTLASMPNDVKTKYLEAKKVIQDLMKKYAQFINEGSDSGIDAESQLYLLLALSQATVDTPRFDTSS